MQWRLMRGNITKNFMWFAFEKIPYISLNCKLVPVQYQEYEYGLLALYWQLKVTLQLILLFGPSCFNWPRFKVIPFKKNL